MIAAHPDVARWFPAFAPRKRAGLAAWLARWRERRAIRRDLMRQPDSMLADFGLSRAALAREAAKPLWRA